MPQNMSILVNGQSHVPPGFRFHPTEEELLHYYLRKKISSERIDLDVIRDVDLNKLEPWDIQETCKIGTAPQNDWYFFSHKDKKYPTGTRTNRATTAGFWKATGRDKVIYSAGDRIGMRKTLVFYKGRAPHGQKSDWIMHEYRLDDNNSDSNVCNITGESTLPEEAWVVCRIFKKKNHLKALDSPLRSSSPMIEETRAMFTSANEEDLEQVLQYVGGMCEEETETNGDAKPFHTTTSNNIGYHERFMKLPSLESPKYSTTSQTCHQQPMINNQVTCGDDQMGSGLSTSWAALDRLVASQLNGQNIETSRQLALLSDQHMGYGTPSDHHHLQVSTLRSSSSFPLPSNRAYHGTGHDYNPETDLWNFANRLTNSDPLCHVSNFSL
ncbi:hypothetical protein Tsubulata_025845 [Turnera subulata]|uniref:NAC domain-containing protein n=1 Tax=Turnera subulata TaxID=218843 RepID=A0A9Q0FJM1_9ROSI|nr:hypothetical protein Tsubulata_025845 [Turnera subulata]